MIPPDPDEDDPIAAYVSRFPEQANDPIPGSPFVPTHPMWCAVKYMPIWGNSEAEIVASFDRLKSAARRALQTGKPILDWQQFRR